MSTRFDWSILSWRQMLELDACARCGECQNWCPVYQEDEREDILPRGKAAAFRRLLAQEGNFLQRLFAGSAPSEEDVDRLAKDLYECSVCGQCHYVCPTGVDTLELWEALRAVMVKAGKGPLPPHEGLRQSIEVNDNPWQQPRSSRDRWAARAAKGRQARIRPVPTFAEKSADVLYYVGCTASFDMNIKEVAINTAQVLQAAGVDFAILGQEERCCASVMNRVGLWDEFTERATANIEQFNGLGIKTLVTSCAGCFKTISQDYPKIAELDFEVLHVAEYLVRLLDEGALELAEPVDMKVTYHDPCHLGRHKGVYEAPREVLGRIPGVSLIEMERNRQNSRCCGAGGGLKAGFPELQGQISNARIADAEKTGAEALVSTCPFCYQGLQVGIANASSSLRMMDLTELVTASLARPAAEEEPAVEAEVEAAEGDGSGEGEASSGRRRRRRRDDGEEGDRRRRRRKKEDADAPLST